MHKQASLYRNAGVDLSKAGELIKRIQPLVRTTFHAGVITDIGGFGALFSFNGSEFKNPVLVSAPDGVGTKLKVAFWADRHDTVGIDLVAMCVNDIIVQGARPLFFLDYLAMGKIDLDQVERIVGGIVAGCREANCSLIGGETAEMPDFYQEGEYDMAGFAVGIVEGEEKQVSSYPPQEKYVEDGTALMWRINTGIYWSEELPFTGWQDLELAVRWSITAGITTTTDAIPSITTWQEATRTAPALSCRLLRNGTRSPMT